MARSTLWHMDVAAASSRRHKRPRLCSAGEPSRRHKRPRLCSTSEPLVPTEKTCSALEPGPTMHVKKRDVLVVRAPAKINLFLEVFGKRPDGYHEIVTFMTAVDLCDVLT